LDVCSSRRTARASAKDDGGGSWFRRLWPLHHILCFSQNWIRNIRFSIMNRPLSQ